jgi:predicted nucleic acid-binding protein
LNTTVKCSTGLGSNAGYCRCLAFHYLILIASTDILPTLFDRVVIPRAVAIELQHPQTPAVVRVWMATSPAWLDIRDVGTAPDVSIAHLDRGEQEAITLAQALHVHR